HAAGEGGKNSWGTGGEPVANLKPRCSQLVVKRNGTTTNDNGKTTKREGTTTALHPTAIESVVKLPRPPPGGGASGSSDGGCVQDRGWNGAVVIRCRVCKAASGGVVSSRTRRRLYASALASGTSCPCPR